MPPARRSSAPPKNISPVIVAVGVVAMFAAFYFGFPGFVVLLLTIVFAGFAAVPPEFTGPKDKSNRPTAANDNESRLMTTYRFWSDMKWRPLIPNSDWLPGLLAQRPRKAIEHIYPVSLVWVCALALGVLAFAIPADGASTVLNASGNFSLLFRALNSFAVFSLIVSVNATLRRTGEPGDPAPTISTAHVMSLRGTPRAIPVLFTGGVLSGIAAVAVLVFGGQNGLGQLYAPMPLPFVVIAIFLLAYAGFLYLSVRTEALARWRLVVAKRAEWDPNWEPMLGSKAKDGTPTLVDYEEVGPFQVITFDAPRAMGYAGVLSLEPKLQAALGGGLDVALLSAPNIDSSGQPMPGTKHPTKFRLVVFASDEFTDFTDTSVDPREVEIGAEVMMSLTAKANGIGRPILLQVSPLFTIPEPEEPDEEEMDEDDEEDDGTPDEPKESWWRRVFRKKPEVQEEEEPEHFTGAWTTQWAIPDGPPFKILADYAGDMEGFAGAEVVIDKRSQTQEIYVGALTADTTPWTNPKTGKDVLNVHENIRWDGIWTNVFQQKTEFVPRREGALYKESTLNGRIILKRQPFSMGQGVELKQYRGYEEKLKISLSAAPFVAITGFKASGAGKRPGERNPQGMCVVWSNDPSIPPSPEELKPNSERDAAEWVLTGMLNRAFDETKRLGRPEIISAACLTDRTSRGHIWEMKLRLYEGSTLEEVRQLAQKIRQSLGVTWMRVIEDQYGCTIAAGSNPKDDGIVLLNPKTEKRIAELDWEAAFAMKGGVTGDGGTLPKMLTRTTLEKNTAVEVLDFEIPPGTSIDDIKSSMKTVGPATDNAFTQVIPTEDPKVVRVLASRRNPLKNSYSPDWDEIAHSKGIPFATGVDGSPIVFNPKETPHLMILGLSGGGKSVTVQGILYGALMRGWEVTVLNPVKGAGDYLFAEQYLYGMCVELDDYFQPAAMMRTLYDEVVRRMRLLGEYGVTKVGDLPEDVRPRHHMIILDEFTSAIMADQVPPKTDDAELEEERELILAKNVAKQRIAQYTGKILREARAAGFTILLATQKLTAKSLDSIPGGGDMKSQLSRLLLGNASYGDKMSGLRNPDKAPDLGEVVPPGRGIYEPSTGSPVILQGWYADVSEYGDRLTRTLTPVPNEAKYDASRYLVDPTDKGDADEVEIPDAFGDFDDGMPSHFEDDEDADNDGREDVIGEAMSFSLDGDLFSDSASEDDDPFGDNAFDFELPDGDEPSGEDSSAVVAGGDEDDDPEVDVPDMPVDDDEDGHVPTDEGHDSAVILDFDGVIAPSRPSGETTAVDVPGQGTVHFLGSAIRRSFSLDAELVLGTDWETNTANWALGGTDLKSIPRVENTDQWWKVRAIAMWVDDRPDIENVVVVDDRLNERMTEDGPSNGEEIAQYLESVGVRYLLVAPDSEVGITADEFDRIESFLRGVDEERVIPDPVPEDVDESEPDDEYDIPDIVTPEPAPRPASRREARNASSGTDFFDFLGDAPVRERNIDRS